MARQGPGVREGEERQPGNQTLRPYSLGSGGASTAPKRGRRTGVPSLPKAISGLGETAPRSAAILKERSAPLALPGEEDRASFLGAAGLLAYVQQPRDPGTFISCLFPWRKLRSLGPHPDVLKALAVSEPPPALGLDEAPHPEIPRETRPNPFVTRLGTHVYIICVTVYVLSVSSLGCRQGLSTVLVAAKFSGPGMEQARHSVFAEE